MKRQCKLMLCLLMAVVLLSSCSGGSSNQTVFPEVQQNLGTPQQLDAPVNEPADEPVNEPDTEPEYVPEDDEGSVFTDNPYLEDQGFHETDPLAEEDYQEPFDLSNRPRTEKNNRIAITMTRTNGMYPWIPEPTADASPNTKSNPVYVSPPTLHQG